MNSYSTIMIYKNCQIEKGKNFHLSQADLGLYLRSLYTLNTNSNYGISCQYMKNQLKTSVIIDLSQTIFASYSSPELLKYSGDNYNYAKVINYDVVNNTHHVEDTTYYFITDRIWKSDGSVELVLEMDVINTFLASTTLSNYLTEKTLILRQHKDRWAHGSEPGLYHPVVDLYSEGILAPLFKKREDTLYEQFGVSAHLDLGSYYLIYRATTQGDNQPLDIFLTSDEPLRIDRGPIGWKGYLNTRELGSDKQLLIWGSDTITYMGSTYNNRSCYIEFRNGWNATVQIYVEANFLIQIKGTRVIVCHFDGNGNRVVDHTYNINMSYRNVYIRDLYIAREHSSSDSGITQSAMTSFTASTEYGAHANQYVSIGTIDDVDRSDPKLMKIVKLPYRPASWNRNADTILLPSGFSVAEFSSGINMLKMDNHQPISSLRGYNISLTNDNYDDISPANAVASRSISNFGSLSALRSQEFETKLLHSDYYVQKFVYDSFVFDFKCEFMGGFEAATGFFVNQITSLCISSKFLFEFRIDLNDHQNYSRILHINRNNELVLYNSAYLNYVRNGYNFDTKTRNRQLTSSLVIGGIALAGGVAAGIAGGPFGVAAAVGLGTTAVSTLTRTAFNTAQADQNIQEKLKSSEMQGTSVLGADELDLLDYYTNGTKAKYVVYEVSDKMKKAMFDLFHYCGYIANYQGIPTANSRVWFNFVQCEPVFKNTLTATQELKEALAEKFKEGITFLHKPANQSVDFEQKYENWEKSL